MLLFYFIHRASAICLKCRCISSN